VVLKRGVLFSSALIFNSIIPLSFLSDRGGPGLSILGERLQDKPSTNTLVHPTGPALRVFLTTKQCDDRPICILLSIKAQPHKNVQMDLGFFFFFFFFKKMGNFTWPS